MIAFAQVLCLNDVRVSCVRQSSCLEQMVMAVCLLLASCSLFQSDSLAHLPGA